MRFFLIFIFTYFFINLSDTQLVSMFGNAIQAKNCEEWGDWGPCIWLKGDQPRFHRSYFDQLLPGRKGCRTHIFFKLLRDRWGAAFSNVVDYLRNVTVSTQQCGFCSYQQSCGRKCTRRGEPTSINPLFVAERLCPDVDQLDSCKFMPLKDQGCTFWPNPTIQLPNVTESMLQIVNNIQFLNCLPENGPNGASVCRCCCAPYFPNQENNYQCEIPYAYNVTKA